MKVLRNNATYPGILNGLQVYLGIWTNGDGAATHTFTIDNIPSPNVVFHIAYAGTTLIAATETTGTQIGTRKITWTVPISGVLKYLVAYSDGYTDLAASASVDTIVSDHEVY